MQNAQSGVKNLTFGETRLQCIARIAFPIPWFLHSMVESMVVIIMYRCGEWVLL